MCEIFYGIDVQVHYCLMEIALCYGSICLTIGITPQLLVEAVSYIICKEHL
jgi:hypothetical protein